MSGKRVVILGGGVGGVVAANRLRKALGKEHQVTVIDQTRTHSFAPSYLWLMVGQRKPEGISRDLGRLERKGIEFKQAAVQRIDTERSIVATDKGEESYDYLVVSLGARMAPEALPGFAAGARSYYTLEEAVKLRDALPQFQGGKVVLLISSMPFKCPAAPYEGALLLDAYFRKRRIRDKVDFHVYTPEPQPMPVAGVAVGAQVCGLLEQRNIHYHTGAKATSIAPDKRVISFEKGDSVKYDFLVGIPPHACPEAVKASGLTNGGPWVPVDPRTLKTKHSNVWAIGDVTAVPLLNKMMLPKAGVFAHAEAEIVAKSIVHEVTGRGHPEEFDGHGA
ncbi:MAG: FAD/NAD(P)-binding oxidoreductase [Dehalococcoidia bacterium]|nr:FAD/NAD(P)-binding oxidoreductase [Dehalococcoidia bacterium]